MRSNILSLTSTAERIHETRERDEAFSQLKDISSRLGLDQNTTDEARSIYNRAIEKHVAHGVSPSTIAAASVYVACKESTIHIGFKQLARLLHSRSSVRSIGKCYRLLVRGLNILLPDSTTEAENYALKIARSTGKSQDATRLSRRIIELARNSGDGSAGKDSAGVAAAALYLACISLGEEATQDELADAASITPVALRHSAKALRPLLDAIAKV